MSAENLLITVQGLHGEAHDQFRDELAELCKKYESRHGCVLSVTSPETRAAMPAGLSVPQELQFYVYGYRHVHPEEEMRRGGYEALGAIHKEPFVGMSSAIVAADNLLKDESNSVFYAVCVSCTGEVVHTAKAQEGGYGLRFLDEQGYVLSRRSWLPTVQVAHQEALLAALSAREDALWTSVNVLDFHGSKNSPEILYKVARN